MLEEALAPNAGGVPLNGARPPAVADQLLGGRILPFRGEVAADGAGQHGPRGVVASRKSGGNVELGVARRKHCRGQPAVYALGSSGSRTWSDLSGTGGRESRRFGRCGGGKGWIEKCQRSLARYR